MRFVVDAQLPPALARWLVAEGHDARHVFDIDMGRASDDAIWTFAVQNSMVILSKDEDFARRRALVVSGPAVVWIRLPNSRRSALLAWMAKVLPGVLLLLARGETLIEAI